MKTATVICRLLSQEEVESFTDEQLENLNAVLSQLGPNTTKISKDYLLETVQKSRVAIAFSTQTPNKVIGVACLAPISAITSRVGLLTHIVVDKPMRRHGIAAALLSLLIKEARNLSLKRIDLTSQSTRTEAQAFWQKQGFTTRETNNFRLELM